MRVVVPFNYNGGGMLQDQYQLSLIQADIYLSLPFIIYAIGSPTLGPFVGTLLYPIFAYSPL
jgi:hypothetical protein